MLQITHASESSSEVVTSYNPPADTPYNTESQPPTADGLFMTFAWFQVLTDSLCSPQSRSACFAL